MIRSGFVILTADVGALSSGVDTGRSGTTSFADLSPRRPMKLACLTTPSAVNSAKAISATSSGFRSEEHTSELQSLMRISYAVFCLKKKKKKQEQKNEIQNKTNNKKNKKTNRNQRTQQRRNR